MKPSRLGAIGFALAGVAASLSSTGCGGDSATPGPTGDVFIAFAPDFADFKTWTAFDLGDDQTDGLPAVGHRTAYLNKLPPTGSSAFPVGTVIVKTIGEETTTPGQTFAMAKRGGGYNALGTIGWEWFELKPDTTGKPAIAWRGIAPPSGETYAGVMGGSCNDCHAKATDNDYVPSVELSLSLF